MALYTPAGRCAMRFDNSWKAVFVPGDGTSYFEKHRDRPFDTATTTYSPINAWWLAEISRVVYRHDKVTRAQILTEAGFFEREFFDKDGTQCAFLESLPGGLHPSLAVLVFRGTEEFRDWLADANALRVSWGGTGRVHDGFRRALNTVWEKVAALLITSDKPLYYTGHSLGAAL